MRKRVGGWGQATPAAGDSERALKKKTKKKEHRQLQAKEHRQLQAKEQAKPQAYGKGRAEFLLDLLRDPKRPDRAALSSHLVGEGSGGGRRERRTCAAYAHTDMHARGDLAVGSWPQGQPEHYGACLRSSGCARTQTVQRPAPIGQCPHALPYLTLPYLDTIIPNCTKIVKIMHFGNVNYSL